MNHFFLVRVRLAADPQSFERFSMQSHRILSIKINTIHMYIQILETATMGLGGSFEPANMVCGYRNDLLDKSWAASRLEKCLHNLAAFFIAYTHVQALKVWADSWQGFHDLAVG
jgi:hypothetical protein